MHTLRRLLFCLSLILPLVAVAQDGKIRGRITDKVTKEPLIGASVAVDRTKLGASTDVNGEYVIIGVSPETYTLRISFVGYKDVTISNVIVNANITTTQDFAISQGAVEVGEVVIVATRPMIQKNTTNTVRLTTEEDIKNLPFRGTQNILALNAGVVQQNGNLYVRGGRSNEVAYYIENASVTNPYFEASGRQGVAVIQEAIQEIQIQSGGFSAEFGGANSGIAVTRMRTGGEKYSVTLDYQTDDFAKPGEKFLNTSSYGYKNAVVTISGPIFSDLTFFVAGQSNYQRTNPMFLSPFTFTGLKTDQYYTYGANVPLPDSIIAFKENYVPGNWNTNNTAQGTLQYTFLPFKVRLSGSYSNDKSPVGRGWAPFALTNANALTNYFWKKTQFDKTNSGFGNLKLTHVINQSTFYDVGFSYYKRSYEQYDNELGSNWKSYVDSATAPIRGPQTFTDSLYAYYAKRVAPKNFSTIYNYRFTNPYAPVNNYEINNQSSIGGTLNLTSQLNSNFELKVGGRFEMWTMRRYAVGDIATYLDYLDKDQTYLNPTGDATFNMTRDVELTRKGAMDHYGYNVDGKEVDKGVNKARKPLLASAYAQSKLEYRDLVLNFGLRYEYFDQNVQVSNEVVAPAWNNQLDYFADPGTQLVDSKPTQLLLPRISFSFPVSENTVFYAQYGKYAQLPALTRLFSGALQLAARISPISRTSYTLQNSPTGAGMFVKPEKTTQYEMGFRQMLTDDLAVSISGFYKDVKDQIQIRRIFNDAGVPIYASYLNLDFSTIKGVEMTLELRRTNGILAKLYYTLSDARGSASTPNSSRVAVSDDNFARFPNFINPFEFNQTHKGTVFLDYRFEKGKSNKILEGLGANLLLSFNSGHNYTKILEPLNLGQASPWNIGVRPLIDPRTRNPIEPINASTTPWVFNVDLNVSKVFYTDFGSFELYVNVLNLLNTKSVINIYNNTGTPTDDGWLRSTLSTAYKEIPNYTEFYQKVNIDNRAAYISATGNDVYSTPRQIRVGARVEL